MKRSVFYFKSTESKIFGYICNIKRKKCITDKWGV